MDPLTASLIAGPALGLAGGLVSPGGENTEGFEDIPIDGLGSSTIRQLIGQGISQTGRISDLAEQRLAEPVSLGGAVAQTPPSFSGGGLPMDIGVTGRDPAIADPSLLSLPGFKLPSSTDVVDDKINNPKFPGFQGDKTANPKFPGSVKADPKLSNPKFPGSSPAGDGIRRRRLDAGLPGTRTTTAGTSSDDLIAGEADRAMAALFMLQNARPPGGGAPL